MTMHSDKLVVSSVDKYCESICRNGSCSELLNEIFVYTGLIKVSG